MSIIYERRLSLRDSVEPPRKSIFRLRMSWLRRVVLASVAFWTSLLIVAFYVV